MVTYPRIIMDFEQFLAKCDTLGAELPGEKAQFLMAPYGRKSKSLAIKLAPKIKKSAVMALFYPKGSSTHFILIERAFSSGVHSKQVAFPGGKSEPFDANTLQTALRETEEEVGVNSQDIRAICSLTDLFIPPSAYLVYPYLGYLPYEPTFKLQTTEVAAVLTPSIKWLLNDQNIAEKVFSSGFNGLKVKSKCFVYHKHDIWGATAMILSEIKSILLLN